VKNESPAVHNVASTLHGGEGEAYVDCDADQRQPSFALTYLVGQGAPALSQSSRNAINRSLE
jgi:hypothetical protein